MNKEITAKTKYVRTTARKARLVVDLVRGEKAVEAMEMLKFVNKSAALPVRKTIASAIANAVNNDNMDRNALVITEARVDEAPTFKRGRAVSRGRYHRILKRNSHIIIKVAEINKVESKKVDKKAKKTEKKSEKVVKSEASKSKKEKSNKQTSKTKEVKKTTKK